MCFWKMRIYLALTFGARVKLLILIFLLGRSRNVKVRIIFTNYSYISYISYILTFLHSGSDTSVFTGVFVKSGMFSLTLSISVVLTFLTFSSTHTLLLSWVSVCL